MTTLALGLALICLMLIIGLFKWCLNQFMFIQALLAGMNQDSDNQWAAIHNLEQRPCPITGGTHGNNLGPKPKTTEAPHAADIPHNQNS